MSSILGFLGWNFLEAILFVFFFSFVCIRRSPREILSHEYFSLLKIPQNNRNKNKQTQPETNFNELLSLWDKFFDCGKIEGFEYFLAFTSKFQRRNEQILFKNKYISTFYQIFHRVKFLGYVFRTFWVKWPFPKALKKHKFVYLIWYNNFFLFVLDTFGHFNSFPLRFINHKKSPLWQFIYKISKLQPLEGFCIGNFLRFDAHSSDICEVYDTIVSCF